MCLDDEIDFKSYDNRKNSFKNWNYEHIIKQENLAKNGFYFFGEEDKQQAERITAELKANPHSGRKEKKIPLPNDEDIRRKKN